MAAPAVQVFALGRFSVLVEGEPVPDSAWRRRSARQLLKILLTSSNRRRTRDEILELLWPDSESDAAAANLRAAIFSLRQVLEQPRRNTTTDLVFNDRYSVWLRTDSELWLDADAFLDAIQRAARVGDALSVLQDASDLYVGHLLPDDRREAWAEERRDALKREWVELQIRLSRELDARGDADAALRPLSRVLQLDAAQERAAREAVQLLARNGHRAEALRVYQRTAQALIDEFGVEPSNDFKALHRTIAEGDLDAPVARAGDYRCSYPFPEPAQFVGRESELAMLERLLLAGRSTGQALVIGAPAGTGKSALLGRLAQLAQARGMLCLAGGCYEERAAMPLGPFHDALLDFLLTDSPDRLKAPGGIDDLVHVIPELRYHLHLQSGDGAGHETIDRVRAFAAVHAVLRRLTEQGPVLLCLEDLHAADEATLQLLHYLARQMRRLPLLLAATYRNDEAPPGQPLAQVLVAMQREHLVETLQLNALGQRETERLAESILDAAPSQRLSESLYTTTAGNPLFVEQLVLALLESGQLRRRGGFWHGTTDFEGAPGLVREVISERLRRLPADCRETLAMASVLGQSFEYGVLFSTAETADESNLLEQLDEAISARVLRETPGGFGFVHAFLRDAVYWELHAEHRTGLHARAAECLERLRGPHADDHAAELAHHFYRAGESTPARSKALHYSMIAGQRAADLSSYPESLLHFNHASELLEDDSSLADARTRLEGLFGRGLAVTELARWSEGVDIYRQALPLATDPILRARARKVTAFSLSHLGAFDEVIAECEAGLAEVAGLSGPEVVEIRATVLQLIGLTHMVRGQFRQLLSVGRRMEIETAGAPPGPRSLTRKVLGWGYMALGQMPEAIEQMSLTVTETEAHGEKLNVAHAHEGLGQTYFFGGQFEEASAQLERALVLFNESANELRASHSVHLLCRVWIAQGKYSLAREKILQALELEAEAHERWLADAYHILGMVHLLSGELQAAFTCFSSEVDVRGESGHLPGMVEALTYQGLVRLYTGEWGDAAALYSEALDVAQSIDPSPPTVFARRSYGQLCLLTGDADAARAEIDIAYEIARHIPASLEHAPAVRAKAALLACEKRFEESYALAREALASARPVDEIVECHVTLSALALELDRDDEARIHAEDAVTVARRLESPRLICVAELALGRWQMRFAPAAARASLLSALDHTDATRFPLERAEVLTSLADCLRAQQGAPEDTAQLEAEAQSIMHRLRASIAAPVAALRA